MPGRERRRGGGGAHGDAPPQTALTLLLQGRRGDFQMLILQLLLLLLLWRHRRWEGRDLRRRRRRRGGEHLQGVAAATAAAAAKAAGRTLLHHLATVSLSLDAAAFGIRNNGNSGIWRRCQPTHRLYRLVIEFIISTGTKLLSAYSIYVMQLTPTRSAFSSLWVKVKATNKYSRSFGYRSQLTHLCFQSLLTKLIIIIIQVFLLTIGILHWDA